MLINGAANQVRFLKSLGIAESGGLPSWPLPNMKPATEIDFWGYRSTWSFKVEAWVGRRRIDGEWATVLIYFADQGYRLSGGFAIAYFYQYQKEHVEYYQWSACDHDFKERNIGHCLHKSTCSKCGESFETDSSG